MTYRLPWHRRIFKQLWFQRLACWVLAQILKLLRLTYRTELVVHPEASSIIEGEENAIFCFWHGRMIVLPFYYPKKLPMHVLISHHRDGALIARLISHFGIQSVRGSSSRGVKEATRILEQLLYKGHNIAITPDGPRGPVQQAAKGAAFIAKRSGKKLLPVSYSASRAKRLSSWDKFMIPLPFARIVLEVGAPITAQEDGDVRLSLETSLNQLTDRVDQRAAS